MKLKKDKAKVIDEVWTKERVRSFLDLKPCAGVNHDFHRLLRAYRSMRVEDFALFIGFFIDSGGDINALSPLGQKLLDIVSSHRHGVAYADILRASTTR